MKKGLFSVSYAGFWGQDALEAVGVIRKARDLGYDGVLLMAKRPHLSPVDTDEADIGRIGEALASTGVELIGLAGYTDYLLTAPAEVPIDEMQELYVEACARICARLGGSVVRVFTGYDYGDLSRAAQEARVARAVESCARRAAEHGILLSVQNHHDFAVDTKEFALFLGSLAADNVRAGYDAWSPHLRGEDLYTGARAMAPKMFMTICADYLTFPRYRYEAGLVNYRRVAPDSVKATKMGAGEIDYDAFFRGLDDGGFDSGAWAVYEMCSPVVGGGAMENLDLHARAFVDWIDGRS